MASTTPANHGEGFDQQQAARFLQLLGKDPAKCWFRSILFPSGSGANAARGGADLHGFDAQALEADSRTLHGLYLVIGHATRATGKAKAVTNDDIESVSAVWAEWDDRPIDWQLQAWREKGLPEPSLIVLTGGKSAHLYWLFDQPMAPGPWRKLEERLIGHLEADSNICNPGRVMRLPGSFHIDKRTGKRTGTRAEIVHEAGHRYRPEDIEACLPPLVTSRPRIPLEDPPRQHRERSTRSLEEVREAAGFIPRREPGNGTYPTDRNALCGCAAALEEAGCTDPDGVALQLLGDRWPSQRDAEQVLRSSTTRNAASFWAIAREHGYDLRRSAPAPAQGAGAAGAAPRQEGQQQASKPRTGKVVPLEQVRQQLTEALADGLGAAALAELIAQLAEDSGIPGQSIQRIAEALQREQGQAVAVAAEARQLAAEADRKEIGQVLTPAYLLPATIAAALEVRTRYLPCDGPSAVLPFLVAVAGLVKLGTRVEGCAAADYRTPVNLYGCLVGKTGGKKSPIHALLVDRPTYALRAELAASHAHDLDEWREACQAIKKGEPKPEPPQAKRLMVGDYTGEALAAQLQTQEEAGLGLLIHRDELKAVFGSLNQYRGGRGGDEQQLLELFDGGGLTSLRVGGHRTYSRSQVSIWGGTQPEILRELVANGDASGLWARFLFVPLPERVVPLPMERNAAEEAEAEWAAETLAATCRAVYRLMPRTYALAPAAASRFASYEENRQRAALKATVGAVSAVFGKSAGKVLRVAGVLHLLQIAAEEIRETDDITAATIDRATALVDHLDAWALSLHSEVAAGGVGQTMRTVHRAAEDAGDLIRWKELAMRLSSKQRKEIDAAAFGEAARALAAAGYGELEAGKRGAISYRAIAPLP